MGYDCYWVDDPNRQIRDQVAETFGELAARQPDSMTAAMVHEVSYAAQTRIPGYHRASNALMRSLILEMEAQGMFKDAPGLRVKLSEQHGTATADEVHQALAHVPVLVAPLEAFPHVELTAFDQALAKLPGLVTGGAETVMRMPSPVWTQRWAGWIDFLCGAAYNGGFTIQ
ncbi:MAG: hypothetical protein ACKVWR_19495 [Acidimicrobiales bacterium]